MEEPPARNAAWRFGFNVPANYDDVGLNCGGISVQKSNGGKCGICGDSYSGERLHETGGKYATNIIVRHYLSGTSIDVKILLSANHKGFMELRLCPIVDDTVEVTQECLDQNILQIENYGTQFIVDETMDVVFFRAQLPIGLSCRRCVLQWRYHAGNNWGRNFETGEACLGCGAQEEFYNCADISISAKENSILLPRPISVNVGKPFDVFLSDHFDPLTSTMTPFIPESSSSLIPMNIPLKELMHLSNSPVHCYPTNEALKPILGIETWCFQLCAISCPPTLCACVKI